MESLLALAALVLPLGAALDYLARRSTKRVVTRWLFDTIRPAEPKRFAASAIFDRFFGHKIYSWKSAMASLKLFAAFTGVSVLLVIITTDRSGYRQLAEGLIPSNSLAMICLVIVTILCFFVDFLAYGKARVLMRAAESSTEKGVSAVLLIADTVVNAGVFIIAFSFGRLLCMMILVYFSGAQFSSSSFETFSDVTARSIFRLGVDPSELRRAANSNQPSSKLAQQLLDQRGDWLSDVSEQQARIRLGLEFKDKIPEFVTFKAKLSCVSAQEINDPWSYRLRSAYVNSHHVALRALGEIRPNATYDTEKITSSFREEFAKEAKSVETPNDCKLKLVEYERKIDIKALTSDLNLVDSYLVSFSLTVEDLTMSLATKLAQFATADVSDDMEEFFAMNRGVGAIPVLGIGKVDERKIVEAGMVSNGTIKGAPDVKLPVGSLFVSSFAASMLYWIFALVRLSRSILSRLYKISRRVVPAMKLPSLVFTFLGSVVALALTMLAISYKLVEVVWRTTWA